jgi:serine/arginine repetitive matrix protein 2
VQTYFLRAHVSSQILIHGLDPRLQTPKEHIIAKLNALFPPIAAAKLDSAAPLAPYSDGLRESIRFSVYEHLMRGNVIDMTEWRAFQTRLFSWCNMPGYAEARDALLRYTEEFKKIEVLCLSTLHSLESRRRSLCIPESLADASFLTSSSRSSAAPSPCSSFFGSDKSADFEPGLQDYHHSFASGPSLCSSTRRAAQHAPLLRGMPGREISAAKTDGAAFAGDLDAPPILTYPHDLSRHEFDQHPLARHLDMSPREKMQLGLIIPRQLSSRDF